MVSSFQHADFFTIIYLLGIWLQIYNENLEFFQPVLGLFVGDLKEIKELLLLVAGWTLDTGKIEF
jgi:hypothetical protein